jgi:hypothetical protein
VKDYVNGVPTDSNALFNELYDESSEYQHVNELIVEVMRLVIPAELLGAKNRRILMQMIDTFISMKRFENFKMEDFLMRMDVFELKWVNCGYNSKYHRQIITRRRKLLALTVGWIVNEIVVPIIKLNFYVTEKHK